MNQVYKLGVFYSFNNVLPCSLLVLRIAEFNTVKYIYRSIIFAFIVPTFVCPVRKRHACFIIVPVRISQTTL